MNSCLSATLPLFFACALPLAAQDPAWLPNHGQWPPEVRAAMRHGAMTTWLTDRGWVTRAVDGVGSPMPRLDLGPMAPLPATREAVVSVELPGVKGGVVCMEPLAGTMAFFVDGDPRRWAPAVPRFAVTAWRDAWPGIDLVFAVRDGALCYDLRVAPGADLGAAQLRVSGMESLAIDGDGGLVLATPCGTLRHGAPIAWQLDALGKRVSVASRFVLHGPDRVGFAVDGFDPARALIVDPPLQWLAMHGGSGGEGVASIRCVDRNAAGELALCGATSSFNFPTPGPTPTTGGLDGFVSVFSPSGSLLWGAVVGGSSGMDFHRACLWDAQGGVTFVGSSSSGPVGPYPTTAGALQAACSGPYGHQATGDMVMGRVQRTASGVAITWATYLGGGGHEQANGVASTPNGKIAIAGWTNSTGMPANGYQTALAGGFDSYLVVLDPWAVGSAQFVSGTYLGGGAVDYAAGIATDALGRVYFGGASESVAPTPHPTVNALQASNAGGSDGVVAVLDATLATLLYGTYLGGSGTDSAQDIALDGRGRLAVGDWTAGLSFAMPPGAFQPVMNSSEDGFVLLLDPWAPGAQLVWGSYLGGSMRDGINGVAVDAAGRVTVVGTTQGTAPNPSWPFPWNPGGFPITHGAMQQAFAGGGWDAFIARFDPDRVGGDALVYSTFLGGIGFDYAYDVLLDDRALTTVVGPTNSSMLFGSTGAGGGDVFLASIGLLANVAERHGAPSPACSSAFADAYHRVLPTGGLDLTLTVSGAVPASIGILAFGDPNPVGTPVALPPTLMVHLSLAAPIALLSPLVIDLHGRASHRVTVPGGGTSYGVSVQWLLVGGCAPWSTSDALRL